MDSTTTSGDSSCDDDTRPTKREKAVKSLNEALVTEELDEKDYHIREALQLVTLEDE